MLVAHAGYPAGLEALRELHQAWPGRARATREGGLAAWRRRGARLCARVYGPVTPRLLASLDALHPDVRAWVVEEGYGRILSRPGLAAVDRERIAVAVLAATGWERQLASHALGAKRMAASPASVRRALAIGLEGAPPERRRAAARAWRTAFGRG
jgi:4-carboxymuconolactone decarboxylase